MVQSQIPQESCWNAIHSLVCGWADKEGRKGRGKHLAVSSKPNTTQHTMQRKQAREGGQLQLAKPLSKNSKETIQVMQRVWDTVTFRCPLDKPFRCFPLCLLFLLVSFFPAYLLACLLHVLLPSRFHATAIVWMYNAQVPKYQAVDLGSLGTLTRPRGPQFECSVH